MPKSSPESEPQRCDCPRCTAHAAGERGPFTSQDFVRLFGVVNEPAPVEVPAELAALGIAVDVARQRYEVTLGEWSAASRRAAIAESAQSRHTGTPSPAERQAAADAGDEEAATKDELTEAGEVLERAQVAYNSLARRLQDRAAMEAYRLEQEGLAAEREAARVARKTSARRGGLRAIRAKVSGVTA